MQRALPLFLLLLATAVAGCLSGDNGADDAGPDSPGGGGADGPDANGPGADAAPLAVPEWRVGDYWTFDSTGGPYTLVVTAVESRDYIIGTDGDSFAFFHAQDPISTFGEQRRSDLAGSQADGVRVEFFQWPPTDGASWTTTWDGLQQRITSTANPDGTWGYEARDAGDESRLLATYTYSPDDRWFRDLTFFDGNGTEVFGSTLQESGSNWTGETVTWDLTELHGATGADATQSADFTVPDGLTDLWLAWSATCTGTGAGLLSFGPGDDPGGQSGEGFSTQLQCPSAVGGTATFNPVPGDWSGGLLGLDGPPSLTADWQILGRTRIATPVGA